MEGIPLAVEVTVLLPVSVGVGCTTIAEDTHCVGLGAGADTDEDEDSVEVAAGAVVSTTVVPTAVLETTVGKDVLFKEPVGRSVALAVASEDDATEDRAADDEVGVAIAVLLPSVLPVGPAEAVLLKPVPAVFAEEEAGTVLLPLSGEAVGRDALEVPE